MGVIDTVSAQRRRHIGAAYSVNHEQVTAQGQGGDRMVKPGRPAARNRACRAARTALAAFGCAVLLACGAPQYHYVTNSTDRAYVRIPTSWQPMDQRQLDSAFGIDPAQTAADVGIWHVAYDAAAVPAIDHLAGWTATAPAVVVAVHQVAEPERGQLSLDRLRDLFLPVSAARRQQVASSPATYSDFALYADDVLTPGDGLRGVHVVYRYAFAGGPPQMIDQTVYLNDDASRLYLLLVRCTTTCYADRHEEIAKVVSSFTVRGSP